MKSEVEILSHWTTNRFTFFFWKWSIPNHQKSLKKNSPLPNHDPRFLCLVQPLKVQQQDSLFSNIFLMLKKCCAGLKSLPATYEPNDLEWQVSENPWWRLEMMSSHLHQPTPNSQKKTESSWVMLQKGGWNPHLLKLPWKSDVWQYVLCIYIYMSLISFTHFVLSLVCFHCCMEDQSLETDSVIFATTSWESNMGPRRRALKKKH